MRKGDQVIKTQEEHKHVTRAVLDVPCHCWVENLHFYHYWGMSHTPLIHYENEETNANKIASEE